MYKVIASAAAALALTACVTPTYYQPAGPQNGVGFFETQIEQNRWRVTFQGGQGAPAAQVTDYAYLRAAELTLQQGYDWFRVVDRYGEARGGYGGGPSVSIGGGTSTFRGRRWGGSASGVGVGLSFPLGQSGPALTSSIEVVMGRGTRPDSPDAYDARQIQQSIRPMGPGPAPGY